MVKNPLVKESYSYVEEGMLPEWCAVYIDYRRVIHRTDKDSVERMWDSGTIDKQQLVDIATDEIHNTGGSMAASMEFYSRFGRDYGRDKYCVTWHDGPEEYSQFYLSSLTENLVNFFNRGVSTEHRWEEVDGENEAFIYVTHVDETEVVGSYG